MILSRYRYRPVTVFWLALPIIHHRFIIVTLPSFIVPHRPTPSHTVPHRLTPFLDVQHRLKPLFNSLTSFIMVKDHFLNFGRSGTVKDVGGLTGS